MTKKSEVSQYLTLTAAVTIAWFGAVSAHAGPHTAINKSRPANFGADGSGGGYVGHADEVLGRARKEAASLLSSVQDVALPASAETRMTVVNAVRNAKLSATESRLRNGRELILDYDRPNHSIIVLKPFADQYTADKYANGPGTDFVSAVKAAEVRLIHEAAHLIGMGIDNDEDAEEFAQRVLQTDSVQAPFENTPDLCARLMVITTVDDSSGTRNCVQAIVRDNCGSDHKLDALIQSGDWRKFRDYSTSVESDLYSCAGQPGSFGRATEATLRRISNFASEAMLEQTMLMIKE